MTEPTTDKLPESGAEETAAAEAATAGTEPNPTPALLAAGSPPSGMPDYKGKPLDPERGPGLGCFWTQVVLLIALLVLTPLSVYMAAPSWLSATMLILIIVLLFFVGQTMVFLLRLVAADRRTRRRPLSSTARATVGQIEERQAAAAVESSDEGDTTPDEPLT